MYRKQIFITLHAIIHFILNLSLSQPGVPFGSACVGGLCPFTEILPTPHTCHKVNQLI